MAKYVYPAIFTEEADGKYSVRFPDVAGCITSGHDLYTATYMANGALGLALFSKEQTGETIPIASNTDMVTTEKNEFVTYITCDTSHFEK